MGGIGRCHRCHMQLPADDLRLDRDLKSWVCRDCLDKVPMTKRVRGTIDPSVDRHFQDKEKSINNLVTYSCSCGYVFARDREKKINRCPYCGRGADAFQKKASAQDFIDTTQGQ